MLDGWSEEAARAWWRDRRAELESLRRTRQAAGAPTSSAIPRTAVGETPFRS
jgi:hypothetical protein